MTVLACLPLIEADIPAVLSLDQRCLGGLWTRSGYQRELDSEHSDILVLVSAPTVSVLEETLVARAQVQRAAVIVSEVETCQPTHQDDNHDNQHNVNKLTNYQLSGNIAAGDPTLLTAAEQGASLTLLGIGCLWAILEEAHITTLAIEPAQQGKKLGQLLLTELLLQAYHRGLERATLEVRGSNERALKLYQKFGFTEAGIRKRYYSDGENARILWRSRLQHPAALESLLAHQEHSIQYLSQQGEGHFIPQRPCQTSSRASSETSSPG